MPESCPGIAQVTATAHSRNMLSSATGVCSLAHGILTISICRPVTEDATSRATFWRMALAIHCCYEGLVLRRRLCRDEFSERFYASHCSMALVERGAGTRFGIPYLRW